MNVKNGKRPVILIVMSAIARIQMRAHKTAFKSSPQETQAMKPKSATSLTMALMLLLLTPLAQADAYAPHAPAPAYVELDATQLDQLVAPIALDPDSLVAQILTASTYPDQVTAADSWLNQNMNVHPDQRAAGANNMSWDPAVKGLIEFPSELDTLAKNTAWTAQLGNAYYNQPGDVMNAIQAMRLQAQQSNVLVTTAQQRVVVEAGVIAIVPVDPAVIYVPYYNPWRVWGTLFVAYPGFEVLPPPVGVVWGTGLAFDPGVAVGVYAGFGWGFGAWAPAWDGGTVMFGGNTYISNSTTVINHGYFGGHDRGVFEHDGHGVPHGYHPCAHAGTARAAADRARAGRSGFGKPSAGHSYAGRGNMGNSHSAYGSRGPASNRGAFGNRGTSAANRGASANRGTSAANRGAFGNRGTSAANRGASANRGTSAANRGASANRGTSPANRGASANRGTSAANRGASANRGTSAANRGASANRGTSAANRGASANRGTSAANHGSAMGNHGGAPANHASNAMASRGGAPSAGHSGGGNGGGHASGGRGHGR